MQEIKSHGRFLPYEASEPGNVMMKETTLRTVLADRKRTGVASGSLAKSLEEPACGVGTGPTHSCLPHHRIQGL